MPYPVPTFELFLLLTMGHFVGDFALQSDRMAREKCPGHGVTLGWGWWLCSHAAIHGFIVGLVTQMPLLGVAEWLLHIVIDIGKCRHLWRLSVDQSLHIGSKAVWALIAISIAGPPGWIR